MDPCPHTDEKTDVSRHTPSEWLVKEPARLGVKGIKYTECTVCERELETEEIPALTYGYVDESYTPPAYKVDVEHKEGGTISSDYTYADDDKKVTITVKPEDGFELDKLVIADRNGNEIPFTDNGDGTYTFSMPDSRVEVTPTFKAIDDTKDAVLVLTIDETAYQLDNENFVNDVAPIIKDDRTMLPIRLVAETLGAEVTWNEAEKSVTIVKGDTVMVIYIGSDYALVNGSPVELDSPAFISNSRTYLPVRFISENLGATVNWNAETRQVTITVA